MSRATVPAMISTAVSPFAGGSGEDSLSRSRRRRGCLSQTVRRWAPSRGGQISKPSVRSVSASTAVLVAAPVSVRCPVKASDVTCSAKETNPVPAAVSRTSWGTATAESNHAHCQRNNDPMAPPTTSATKSTTVSAMRSAKRRSRPGCEVAMSSVPVRDSEDAGECDGGAALPGSATATRSDCRSAAGSGCCFADMGFTRHVRAPSVGDRPGAAG